MIKFKIFYSFIQFFFILFDLKKKMTSKCCGRIFSKRSRSQAILKSLNLKSTPENLASRADASERREFLDDSAVFLERNQSDEILLERTQRKKKDTDTSQIDTRLSTKNIKRFLDQDIDKIRSKNRLFEDPFFIKYISSIVENSHSQLYLSLKSRLKCNSTKELNKAIKWERTFAIASKITGSKNEFVLDNQGNAPTKTLDYAQYFSISDIFQGWLGNCFHIGAMMALTKNEELLQLIIPSDNMSRENMNFGAYHFRFWKLGYWYDTVVDDYLPVNNSSELLFSHNKIFPNEFWVPLFEKAFAK